MVGSINRRVIIIVFGTIILSLLGSPAVFAQTAGAYNNSSCASPSTTSFTQGQTVYGYGAGLSNGHTYYLGYYYPAGTPALIRSGVKASGGAKSVCDSTGYTITNSDPTGTWTLKVCSDTSCSTVLSTSTFTVTAAVPDLPSGVMIFIILMVFIYIALRRRGSV